MSDQDKEASNVLYVAQMAAVMSIGFTILAILAHGVKNRIENLPSPDFLTVAQGIVTYWMAFFLFFLAVIPIYQTLSQLWNRRRVCNEGNITCKD